MSYFSPITRRHIFFHIFNSVWCFFFWESSERCLFFWHFRFWWSNYFLTSIIFFICSFPFWRKIIANHFLLLFIIYVSKKKKIFIIYVKSWWYPLTHSKCMNFFSKYGSHIMTLQYYTWKHCQIYYYNGYRAYTSLYA